MVFKTQNPPTQNAKPENIGRENPPGPASQKVGYNAVLIT